MHGFTRHLFSAPTLLQPGPLPWTPDSSMQPSIGQLILVSHRQRYTQCVRKSTADHPPSHQTCPREFLLVQVVSNGKDGVASQDPWLRTIFSFPIAPDIFKTYLESNHFTSITNILFPAITLHLDHGKSLISLLLISLPSHSQFICKRASGSLKIHTGFP